MSDEIRLTLQVIVSILFILAVLWALWRLPASEDADGGFAPVLAFASPWLGVAAALSGVALWFVADSSVGIAVVVCVALYAAALAGGGWVLWTYRALPPERTPEEISLQRLQARVGIGLGLVAVVLWYVYVATHAG